MKKPYILIAAALLATGAAAQNPSAYFMAVSYTHLTLPTILRV